MRFKKIFLKELIKIKNGKDHKALKDGQYPVYGSGGVIRYVEKYLYDKKSVLLPRKGTLNNIQYVNKPFWTVDTCYYTEVFADKINPYFLYSQLRQFDIEALNTGSAVPSMTFDKYYAIEISVPPITTQHKIASILSAYDDLIENNQNQIKLLEEAAQRLYKEWFVDLRFPGHESVPVIDGIPEGWSRLSMNDIAVYLNGYAFKPDDWNDKGKPIIKIKEMNEGVTKSTPRNDGSDVPEKYNVTAGDILFSWSATLTAMIWDSEDGLLNQHLFKVTPNEGVCREYVLQSILKTLEEFKNLTTGATMKHIQRGKLKEVFVKLPPQKIMDRFSIIAEAYREKILRLRKQNSALQEARGRLLPKLMSGEIEV